VHRLLVTANVVLKSQIFVTLTMEALCTSETSVLTRVTGCIILEDDIIHEEMYFDSYNTVTGDRFHRKNYNRTCNF
jgi:hypothetical protein